jgi:putative transposase
MARLARVIAPGLPHHVTQRGNRRQPIFLAPGDQEIYRDILAEQVRRRGVEVWAYCLMPNHVHLILTPCDERGLGLAVGEAHRRYTNFVNARGRWSGHLFQNRFASVVMDERHLLAAARYVSLNPVRARLAPSACDWPWSSARAHVAGRDDALVAVGPLLGRIDDFAAFLAEAEEPETVQRLRGSETTGRPLGGEAFVRDLEQRLGRKLTRDRPGPPPGARRLAGRPDLNSA